MQDLSTWTPRPFPRPRRLEGRTVTLTAYEAADASRLWEAFGGTAFNELARFFPNPPYDDVKAFAAWLDAAQRDLHTMVYRRADSGEVCGMASYMRVDVNNGSAEVGAVCHAPSLQRSAASTEAQSLMMRHIFDDLGYRRYEWKLNDKNAPSHQAARRLGFTFEGTFRQHMVAKGESRDTAWYAILDVEWPRCRRAFEAWLAPENFDDDGVQRRRLEALREDLGAR